MPNRLYLAYGLNISSEFDCPELHPGSGDAPDVFVRFGRVPDSIENATRQGVIYQVSPTQFLLKLDHIARFLVSDGSEIRIERAPEGSDEDIRGFLLGSILGALLHQRGFLPLHASVIETGQGAVAFAAPSGTGKSTLAAAFHQRGYRVLADDVCAVSLDGFGMPIVTPAYPQLNLWPDALEKVGSPQANLQRTRVIAEKYGLPVTENYSSSEIPLAAVYELHSAPTDGFSLTEVTGLDKIALIRDNTFRMQFLNGKDQRAGYMRTASAIAQHIYAARITRPKDLFLLAELADWIEKDFTAHARER